MATMDHGQAEEILAGSHYQRHRRLVRWRWACPRTGGRPPVDVRLAALIGQIARENPGWGYKRIHRARNLRPLDCDDIITGPVTDLATARIGRHKILGGLTHECQRAA
jgi:hypothetical protein